MKLTIASPLFAKFDGMLLLDLIRLLSDFRNHIIHVRLLFMGTC